MSKLEELIAELCPDGVKNKKLREVASISRGGNFQKKDYVDEGFPCIHYGQIYTLYDMFVSKTANFISNELSSRQKMALPGDIIMAVTSENIEDVCKCIAWLGEGEVAVSGHTAIIHHDLDPKYLVYFLHSSLFYKQKTKLVHGTKVIEVTPDALLGIALPVPPIEVQREIVRILDSFVERKTELIENLTSELVARKNQSKYYSRSLLDHMKNEVEMVSVSSLGKWQGGKTPSMNEKAFWENGTVPWISSKDMKVAVLNDTQDHITQRALKNASMTLFPSGGVAIVTRSGILKHTFPVAYVPFETTVNQDIKILSVRQGVSGRYVSFVLKAYEDEILAKTKKQGGTVDSLDFQKVMNFLIPLPDYDSQLSIVRLLESFEKNYSDLMNCVTAEIEARKKQYEYYRDKLLTFKELPPEDENAVL